MKLRINPPIIQVHTLHTLYLLLTFYNAFWLFYLKIKNIKKHHYNCRNLEILAGRLGKHKHFLIFIYSYDNYIFFGT